jgi:hypothetical protein
MRPEGRVFWLFSKLNGASWYLLKEENKWNYTPEYSTSSSAPIYKSKQVQIKKQEKHPNEKVFFLLTIKL